MLDIWLIILNSCESKLKPVKRHQSKIIIN